MIRGLFGTKSFLKRKFVSWRCNSTSAPINVPPLLMYGTASPYVYVSSTAIDGTIDEEDPSLFVNPKSLFVEKNLPKSFESSQFRYVSPTTFNFELPDKPIPEVAFLGKSNVGKSSLLNALTTKDLAKTSKTPGRTQQPNYFGLYPSFLKNKGKEDAALGYIIDLPGFGYAKAPDEVVSKWQATTQEFLQQRIIDGNLQRVYMLIDSRRGLNTFDSSILGWLDEAECDYTVVLTKADSVSKAKLVKSANEICMRYHAKELENEYETHQSPCVHITSSKKNKGIVELMWAIDADFSLGSEQLKIMEEERKANSQISSKGWGKMK